jgi:hypothetical protein
MNRVIEAWRRWQQLNHTWACELTLFRRKHLDPFRWKLRILGRELLRPFLRSSLLKYPTNLLFEQHLQQWRFFGDVSQYECGVDTSALPGTSSAFLRSTVAHAEFARLEQAIKPDDYRGKHLRFSGEVKAEHVEQQAGLRIRIMTPPSMRQDERSRPGRERLRQEQWVQGTQDWMRYELTLPVPVPEDARAIVFGLILIGAGQVWLANAQLEVIEQDGMPPAER